MDIAVNEIEIAYKEAFALKGNTSNMKFIGAIEGRGTEVYKFYKDENKNYWYTKHFREGDHLISEEEHIFGRKIKRTTRRYKNTCT